MNPLEFELLDKPPRQAVLRALEQLLLLGALGDDGKLKEPLGTRMAQARALSLVSDWLFITNSYIHLPVTLPLPPVYALSIMWRNAIDCAPTLFHILLAACSQYLPFMLSSVSFTVMAITHAHAIVLALLYSRILLSFELRV